VRRGIGGLRAKEHFEVLATPSTLTAAESVLERAADVVDSAFETLLARAEASESQALEVPTPRRAPVGPHPAPEVAVQPVAPPWSGTMPWSTETPAQLPVAAPQPVAPRPTRPARAKPAPRPKPAARVAASGWSRRALADL